MHKSELGSMTKFIMQNRDPPSISSSDSPECNLEGKTEFLNKFDQFKAPMPQVLNIDPPAQGRIGVHYFLTCGPYVCPKKAL